jgi:hypothetical protein
LDSRWLIYFNPVRSRGIFGQQMVKLLQSCPKSRHLRTADSSFTSILSEVEASSDSRRLNYFSCVRSRSIFGQQTANLLQSGLKSRYLRTADGSFTSILSKDEVSSDSRWLNYFKSVRSQEIFLQISFPTRYKKRSVSQAFFC